MKTLSGRQPWWWAILHAGKRIENRRWNTHYRGPILLHAAKGCTEKEFREAMRWMEQAGVIPTSHPAILADMLRGGIVGRATIVNVLLPHTFSCNHVISDLHGADARWHMHDQYGFVLTDVEPLPFVPCKGALGLFELDYGFEQARDLLGANRMARLPHE